MKVSKPANGTSNMAAGCNQKVVKILIAGGFLIATGFLYKLSDLIRIPNYYDGSDAGWIFDPNLSQNDSKLVQFTFNNFLKPPSTLKYNLTNPTGDPAINEKQHLFALKLLSGKKGGFFIECGANNGEFLSPTLVLERDYQWTGLLIEPDPELYPILLSKNRKAWSANACLSTKPYPTNITFIHTTRSDWSGLSAYEVDSKYIVPLTQENTHLTTVTCLPLFTILSALKITEIDFFALDIEGSELKVLKTIPFESISIKVFTIEYPHIPEGVDALNKFMESKGYVFVAKMTGSAPDYLFVHNSLKDNIKIALESNQV